MSYSSACLVNKCQRKYWLSKVAQEKPDLDSSVDTEAFTYGKVYHEVIEKARHRRPDNLKDCVITVGRNHGMDREQIFKVYSMCDRYFKGREKTGLLEVASEISFQTEDFIGYIDAILKDPEGDGWWILDLKTSTRISPTLGSRIHRDIQLNFYTVFASDVAHSLGLSPQKFRGVRYSICARPQAKPKRTETLREYVSRVNVNLDEFFVESQHLRPELAKDFVSQARRKQLELFKVESLEETTPNFLVCEDYFRPCEFWSKCYGHTVTATEKIPISAFPKTEKQELTKSEDDEESLAEF